MCRRILVLWCHLCCLHFGGRHDAAAFMGIPPLGPRCKSGAHGNDHGDDISSGRRVYCRVDDDETGHEGANDSLNGIRGGSTKAGHQHGLLKSSQVTASKVTNFWTSRVGVAKSKIKNVFKSKEERTEEELLDQLQKMPVRSVTVPNSTVLPPDVVRLAVKRSGLVGRPLRTDLVQDVARNLKRWYVRKGYILHSVTGATLKPETATAEIQVEEPSISKMPVNITACKEMIIDEGGDLLTFRQYKEKYAGRRQYRHKQIEKKDLNTTFVVTKRRTRPSSIAKAMKLSPGMPFRWDARRWQKVSSSGVFSQVLNASPVRLPDGTVQLEVYATEPAPRHLEYGMGKSLYSGSWEGEIDFEHRNLLGGGEVAGLMVRRGTKDAAPSVRLRFSDERFGLEGGYDVEIFSEFIGEYNTNDGNFKDEGSIGQASADEEKLESGYESGSLLDRRGATFRLRNPISPNLVTNSVASTSLERTSTTSGLHEKVGSTSLTLGPFRRRLPMEARSSVSTTITGGARVGEKGTNASGPDSTTGRGVMPFGSCSATTRQILPLLAGGIKAETARPPLALALQHTIAGSTANLPRHEAKAMGIAAQIRGASPDGYVSSSIKGTAELRVPLTVPRIGDGGVVVFGDWFFVQQDHSSPFYSKSSVGIGVRKNVQGIPLKYDLCYSNDGKLKHMFGLGLDFDA